MVCTDVTGAGAVEVTEVAVDVTAHGDVGVDDALSGASAHAVVEMPLAGQSQLPGHGGDDDAGCEQQDGLQAQGGLVVKDLLPPVAHDVLGQEDDHEVPGGLSAHRAHVVDDRAGDVSVGRVQDRQRHRDIGLLPSVQETFGATVAGVHRQRLQRGRVGRLGVGQGPQRRLVEA